MTWMKTNFDFGLPFVTLVVSLREAYTHKIRELLTAHDVTPDLKQLEMELTKLITDVRPELEGGALTMISYLGQRFELVYTHPRLPRATDHMTPFRKVHLVPRGDEPVTSLLDGGGEDVTPEPYHVSP